MLLYGCYDFPTLDGAVAAAARSYTTISDGVTARTTVRNATYTKGMGADTVVVSCGHYICLCLNQKQYEYIYLPAPLCMEHPTLIKCRSALLLPHPIVAACLPLRRPLQRSRRR